MHQCLKCGKSVEDVEQINEGCECGSQVFVFIKDSLGNGDSEAENPEEGKIGEENRDWNEVWLAKGATPDTIQPFDIENVRQLMRGVYEVNVGGVSTGPVVVKDEEGVYYVRLPFIQPKPKSGAK